MMLCKEINGANSLDGKLFKKKLLREHKENAIYIFIQFRCYMNKYAQSLMNDLQTVNSENKKRCNHIHEDFENKVADLQAAAARLIETHDNTIARLKAEYPSEAKGFDSKIEKLYADLKDKIQGLNANLKIERDDFCKEIDKELEDYFDNCMTGAIIGLNSTSVSIRDLVRLNSCFEGYNRSLVYK